MALSGFFAPQHLACVLVEKQHVLGYWSFVVLVAVEGSFVACLTVVILTVLVTVEVFSGC